MKFQHNTRYSLLNINKSFLLAGLRGPLVFLGLIMYNISKSLIRQSEPILLSPVIHRWKNKLIEVALFLNSDRNMTE